MGTRVRPVLVVVLAVVACVGWTGGVRSQPVPPGAQTGNRALAAAISSTTPADVRTAKIPSLSGGVVDTILSALGRTPAVSAAGAGPPPLAVRPRSNGCPNVFRGRVDNIRVNQDCSLRRQAEQFIAINPTDPTNLVAGQNDSRIGFNHCGIDYSLDRGRTWGDMLPPFWQFVAKDGHTFDAASDPAVAFDSRGNAYFTCVVFDINSAASAILVTKSNAVFKGSVFHSPDPNPPNTQVFRTEPSGVVANDNDPAIFHDKEFLAADQSPTSPKRDTVYVTWTRFRTACAPGGSGYCESPIYFSQSTTGGATWSPGIEISGKSAGLCDFGNFSDPALDPAKCNFDQGSYPVVGPDGTVYVVFNNGNTPTLVGQQLLVRCLPSKNCAQAASWEGPFGVGEDVATQPFTCPQAAGRQCLPPNSFRINDFPSLAIDRTSGALYAVWADFRNGGPCATNAQGLPVEPCANHNNDVFLARSRDGGLNWEAAVKVNQDTGLAAQVYPWAAVGTNGTIYVGYYDRRYGCETFGCVDVTLSASTDGGLTFTDQRITTSSMPGPETNPVQAGFLGDYNAVAADGQGVVLVWADTRGLYDQNEQDVYFAALPPIGPSGSGTTTGGSGCTGRGCPPPAPSPTPSPVAGR